MTPATGDFEEEARGSPLNGVFKTFSDKQACTALQRCSLPEMLKMMDCPQYLRIIGIGVRRASSRTESTFSRYAIG